MQAYSLHLGPAQCALDLSDGSERGEYVNQDTILHTLGRPHRAVNLMYCYYPLDEGWPARASTLPTADGKEARFAWAYRYDDYFPYQGGLEAAVPEEEAEPFRQMRDIRRHGQDVILTLTVDCGVSDAQLIQIARELRPFGRMMLRINHEATGNWFAFNQRYSYQEVADFFVRFHKIVKKEAPQIRTILCIGNAEGKDGKMRYEDEFAKAIAAADIWSTDAYLSLHWGWPFDIAEPGGGSYKRSRNEQILEEFRFEYERFSARGEGKARPFVVSEFNADGDVNGPFEQAQQVADFYEHLPEEASCVAGITFYQFRDRGRLGLEMEDPSHPECGIAQPILESYKKILVNKAYLPAMTKGEEAVFPASLRWGGSEDADGLAIEPGIRATPVFCEVSFTDADTGLCLMMEFRGKWFYKKPGLQTIDLMPAFFDGENPVSIEEGEALELRLFATPPEGVNDPAQGEGWAENYVSVMQAPPTFRIRYKPTAEI